MRKIYLILLGVLILALLISIPTGDGILMMLFVLLIISPVLALYYLITCINETQKLSQIMAQSVTVNPVNPEKQVG
ncbi:hypothetical protein [Paraflavitalea speifideaquila]|uniref:hypothetical protein n=1 Tax=Paraflavitalea speifideaquila TaxID=3076558 RepID=UPI0028EE8581|nr:hypothetical protein [Paraflavitalea speifideiaquila]